MTRGGSGEIVLFVLLAGIMTFLGWGALRAGHPATKPTLAALAGPPPGMSAESARIAALKERLQRAKMGQG